jgi:hypothetical protein
MLPQSGPVIEVCTKIPIGLILVRGLKVAVIATGQGYTRLARASTIAWHSCGETRGRQRRR